jgi:hypothetical protein
MLEAAGFLIDCLKNEQQAAPLPNSCSLCSQPSSDFAGA